MIRMRTHTTNQSILSYEYSLHCSARMTVPDGLGNVNLAGRERARDVRAHGAGLAVDRNADIGDVDLVGAGVHGLRAAAEEARATMSENARGSERASEKGQ
jgi:hypothetical protein